MSTWRGSHCTMVALVICGAVVSIPCLFQRAYSDGLFQESLPGIPIGGGKYAGLFVRVNPVLIDGPDTLQDRYLRLQFLDVASNSTIPHTTFNVTISRVSGEVGNSTAGEVQLISDRFHSHTGSLTLKLNNPPVGTDEVAQGQQRDPFYGAWLASENGTVFVDGPLFSEGGLYHLRVNIMGYGSDDSRVAQGQIPPFDAWLSIGSATHYNISFDQRDYKITLISYYDKTKQFDFNLENRTVSWAIPFLWNQQHIQQQQINVHEEFRIPKALISDMQSSSFSPSINGVPLTNQAVYLDPYSSATDMTIHYVISKDTLLALQKLNATGGETSGNIGQILFSFLINGPKIMQTTTDLKAINTTSENPISVRVHWSPMQLSAGGLSRATITFLNSGKPINATVLYDMKIRSGANSTAVVDRENLTAANGTDIQQVSFPDNSVYSLEIDIHEVQTGSGEGSLPNGLVTKGIVVVPEFGSVAMPVAAIAVGSAIVVFRRKLI